MNDPTRLLPVWQWFSKMGAPILAAFLIGQYVAGRNCEEGKLREQIAAIEAAGKADRARAETAEIARLASERALSEALKGYNAAVQQEVTNDPRLGDCRALGLPQRLRLPPLPSAAADPR